MLQVHFQNVPMTVPHQQVHSLVLPPTLSLTLLCSSTGRSVMVGWISFINTHTRAAVNLLTPTRSRILCLAFVVKRRASAPSRPWVCPTRSALLRFVFVFLTFVRSELTIRQYLHVFVVVRRYNRVCVFVDTRSFLCSVRINTFRCRAHTSERVRVCVFCRALSCTKPVFEHI